MTRASTAPAPKRTTAKGKGTAPTIPANTESFAEWMDRLEAMAAPGEGPTPEQELLTLYHEGHSVEVVIRRLNMTLRYVLTVAGNGSDWSATAKVGGSARFFDTGKSPREALGKVRDTVTEFHTTGSLKGRPFVVELPTMFDDGFDGGGAVQGAVQGDLMRRCDDCGVELDQFDEACPVCAATDGLPDMDPDAGNEPIAHDLPSIIRAGVVRHCKLAELVDHPDNPRPVYSGLEELAQSLREHGQLVDLIAREREDGKFEILAGHRRKRAAEMAFVATLRVRIIECDDAQAREVLGVDNEQRQNLDAVGKARWYKLMLEANGLSQRQLAEKIGVSQGDIANHVRILSLPGEWQQRVISGEISPTVARSLATWSHRPAVLAVFEKSVMEGVREGWSTEQWLREIVSSVRDDDVTLPMTPGESYRISKKGGWVWGSCRFTSAEIKQYQEELDCEEVPLQYSHGKKKTGLRAFNRQRWFALHANAEKRHEEEQARKSAGVKGATKAADAKKRTPAQERQLREDQDRQLAEKVKRYKLRWLHGRILESPRLAEEPNASRLLMMLATAAKDVQSERINAAIKGAGGKADGWNPGWRSLQTAVNTNQLVKAFLRECLSDDLFAWRSPWQLDDVPAVAEALGIDMAGEWRVDEDFLKLHQRHQLQALFEEWKIPHEVKVFEKSKMADLIADVLERDQKKPVPLPSSLRDDTRRKKPAKKARK